jgi:CRISPR-associated protein Cas5h
MGAILGLPKADNAYLSAFADKQCLLGLSVLNPIIMKRLGTNLRPNLNRTADNPKPTMMEYVYQPKYRLYVSHDDALFYNELRSALQAHRSVFTPSLGLAGLVSNFELVGEIKAEANRLQQIVPIHSVIPRKYFLSFDEAALFDGQNELIEQSLFAIEMNTDREVTERDDILFDRKGKPVQARVTEYYSINDANVVLF